MRRPSRALVSRHVPTLPAPGTRQGRRSPEGRGRLRELAVCSRIWPCPIPALGLCCVTHVYLALAGSREISKQHQALDVPEAAATAMLPPPGCWHHMAQRGPSVCPPPNKGTSPASPALSQAGVGSIPSHGVAEPGIPGVQGKR